VSFSPRQLAAHWVPGFVLLAILFLADKQNNHLYLNRFGQSWDTGIALIALAAAGFATGNFLDALRDLCDDKILGRWQKYRIDWDFLLELETDKVQRIDDYYFMSYVLSANLVIALLICAALDLLFFPDHFPGWAWWILAVALVVFGQDAWRLRNCIVDDTARLLRKARTEKAT
jgi:hypothetical protein